MPTKIKNDINILKPRSDYTDGDKKLSSIKAKIMNTFYYALIRTEFNRISSYKNAWDICLAL